jgi:hypothetical protein
VEQRTQDLAYWWDVILIALGVLSIVAVIGHVENWRTSHSSKDLKIALGFGILLPAVFALTPRRWELLLGVLLTILLFGAVGTVLNRSAAALPVMIPCALLAYLVIKYKFRLDAPRHEK